jgi:hypothetical protein
MVAWRQWKVLLAGRWEALSAAERREQLRRGIPSSLRGIVWQLLGRSVVLSGLATAAVAPADVLARGGECCKLAARPSEEAAAIANDVTRVFPTHPFFAELNGAGQRSLFMVLKAYAVHDPRTGYCQGMGFVAALLLLHMPVEHAFWMLSRLLQTCH